MGEWINKRSRKSIKMKKLLGEEILKQLKLMSVNKKNVLLEQSLTKEQKTFCDKLIASELVGGVDAYKMSKNRKDHPECYGKEKPIDSKSSQLVKNISSKNKSPLPAVWLDLYNKLNQYKPSDVQLKRSDKGDAYFLVYKTGAQLGFWKNGDVKYYNGKKWSKGGKWDFNLNKGNVLTGGWLKNYKGDNVSLKDSIIKPYSNFGLEYGENYGIKTTYTGKNEKGEDVVKNVYDMKNKDDEARLERYKSDGYSDVYDLIYLDELGKKNFSKEIKNLKYNVENKSAFGINYDISEKDSAIKKGYDIYLKALNVRRKNAKSFGWSGSESYKPSDFLDAIFPEYFQTIPLSTAIDPSYIEGVVWVELKEQWLKLAYQLYKLEPELRANYKNYTAFRKGPETFFSKGNQKVNQAYDGPVISNKGSSLNTKPTDVDKKAEDDAIKKDPKYLEIKKQMNLLQEQIDKVVITINMINQWNTQLSFQKEEWKNKSCSKNRIVKLPESKYVKLPARDTASECSGQYVNYNMAGMCKQENQGGLWIVHDKMKWRTNFKGVDFKKLEIKFKDEQQPDVLACGCAKGMEGRLEYDKVSIKSSVLQYCRPGIQTSYFGATQGTPYYFDTGVKVNIKIEAKSLEFQMDDARKVIEKITDWGQNCFTCSDGEGNTDCHCLLDILSIAAVFIPVVGPIVSMLIDLANGGYYLVDALKADNNLDKNSAYLSAGLTILGGLMTGFGQMRSLMLGKPNGKAIVSFGDKFMSEASSRGLKTEIELSKLSEELMATYKLTTKEAKLASSYINGIKALNMSEAKAAVKKFTKTFKDLNSKLGFHNFQQLMGNKNFGELLVKNKGSITNALQEFAKKQMNKEFLTQIGFFVGGESVLPGIISPWAENKVKTGQWGNLEQQIGANGYNFDDVKKEFMSLGNTKDNNLLSAAWNDNKGIKVDGELKAWRPGYPVPLKYQTDTYKKDIAKKQKAEKENKEYDEETKGLESSNSKNFIDSAYDEMDSL